MAKNLFVGNLPFGMTDDNLLQIFSAHGTVTSANVVKDKMTGRSRGFGFVEMTSDDEAAAAIQALNNSDQMGRNIVVKEALPRPERTDRM
jgi:cold-inducible RNA-binding protein